MKTPVEILHECSGEVEELVLFAAAAGRTSTDKEEAFRWRRVVYALSQIAEPSSVVEEKERMNGDA